MTTQQLRLGDWPWTVRLPLRRQRAASACGLLFLLIHGELDPQAASAAAARAGQDHPSMQLQEVHRIWDEAPHNAFTDLANYRGTWFCTFREGTAHVSPDGAIRVLMSPDGFHWRSIARLSHPEADLRDPKLLVTQAPDLWLTAAAAYRAPNPVRHQTLAWRSADGLEWGEPVPIGETNVWIWSLAESPARSNVIYGAGYSTTTTRFVRLYRSRSDTEFEPWVPQLSGPPGYPSEVSLVFDSSNALIALLRRDEPPRSAELGIAHPPYTEWHWRKLGVAIGGPKVIAVPGNRFVAAVRRYDGGERTCLAWLDLSEARLEEALWLPSGGDTSYAGLVWHEDRLWVSYYSSHEGRACIYLAIVRLYPLNDQPRRFGVATRLTPTVARR